MRKWFTIAAAIAGVGLLSGLGYSVVGTGQNAQPEQKIAASKIVKVVAYPNNALSTRFRTRQIFEDAREEVRKLEDEKYKLEMVIEKLNADIKAVDENMKMI